MPAGPGYLEVPDGGLDSVRGEGMCLVRQFCPVMVGFGSRQSPWPLVSGPEFILPADLMAGMLNFVD